jgi:hypothetical protein
MKNFFQIADEAKNAVNEKFTHTEVTTNNWNDKRIYVNKPYESAAYKNVGYVRTSDGAVFPACGDKVRTSRDREAIEILNVVSEILIANK